jgi:LPS-assembly lipoprotein
VNRPILLTCGVLFVLTGCGFHLRGSRSTDHQVSKVFVQSRGAANLAAEIKQQLGYNGIRITQNSKSAEATVTVVNERHDERVLSVDPNTGKAREYELGYQVDFSIQGPDGKTLIPRQLIEINREFTFDETAALGKFEEASLIRDEMKRDAADTILRRLETLSSAVKPAR